MQPLNDEVESRDGRDDDAVYSPAKIARPAAVQCTRFYGDRERGRVGFVNGSPALGKRYGPLCLVKRSYRPMRLTKRGRRRQGKCGDVEGMGSVHYDKNVRKFGHTR